MQVYIIIVCVLIVLNVIVIAIALRLGKKNRIADGIDDDFYNEDGDHIYYDRKLIRYKKHQRSAATKSKNNIKK